MILVILNSVHLLITRLFRGLPETGELFLYVGGESQPLAGKTESLPRDKTDNIIITRIKNYFPVFNITGYFIRRNKTVLTVIGSFSNIKYIFIPNPGVGSIKKGMNYFVVVWNKSVNFLFH